MNVVGDVKGRRCILIDDMIDTAGTLTKAGVALKEQGAKSVFAVATHPVLSGKAHSRLEQSVFEELCVTDCIPLRPELAALPMLKVLSVADLFAQAIRSIHFNDSISRLFVEGG